jgi:hypothetical protein
MEPGKLHIKGRGGGPRAHRKRYSRCMRAVWGAVLLAGLGLCADRARAEAPVHGLWVWKSETLIATPGAGPALDRFCTAAGISEVYVSFPAHLDQRGDSALASLLAGLRQSGIRSEALISSINGDEPGAARAKLIERARGVLEFNARHPQQRFEGIHLDLEPQQRPENKGADNLRFLDGLVGAYREVRALTDAARLTLNADVQIKLLKGDLEQRRKLLSAIPRVTLMLYELSSPDDGTSTAEKEQKLKERAASMLASAYAGLDGGPMARMAIALRTPDYGPLMPRMLALLDEEFRANPHYLGWARHSYNDTLEGR